MRARLRHTAAALAAFALCGLASAQTVLDLPAADLDAENRDPRLLDVTIHVFDPGIPKSKAAQQDAGIFREIREVEASYLPFVLRKTLVDAGDWGVVRVVPQPDRTAEVQVDATIVASDGVRLSLAVRVTDSTGRRWLERRFTQESLNDEIRFTEPFAALYSEIASSMAAARDALDERELRAVIEVSGLRYAAELVPEAYADYLRVEPDGRQVARRLPARGDPIMARVTRVRQFENLFTDTVDEEYRLLQEEIAATYNLWCRYRRQMTAYQQDETQRARNRRNAAPRGSFEAMRRHYDNFKWSKIQDQQLAQWAEGFNNEVDATVVEVEGRVVELRGDLDARYQEWRRILRAIFALETQTP
ncbi:MAG: hypothetical protein AAGD86_08860 [Pseudomonadota bacterium]